LRVSLYAMSDRMKRQLSIANSISKLPH